MIVEFRDDWQNFPCKEWQGSRTVFGYGRAGARGKGHAHREAWKEAHPDFMLSPKEFVMHACDNPPCYRIEHLGLGTAADNMADKEAKGRGNRKLRLSKDQIAQIYELADSGKSRNAIRKATGHGYSTVTRYLNERE